MVISQRCVDVQMAPSPGQSHIKEPPFLIDALRRASRHVGRKRTVGGMDEVHHVPFATLRRVDGRQCEPVVVQRRFPGEIARRAGRIKGQVGEKGVKVGVIDSQPGQGIEIGQAGLGMIIDSPDHRLENATEELYPGSQRKTLVPASSQPIGDPVEVDARTVVRPMDRRIGAESVEWTG